MIKKTLLASSLSLIIGGCAVTPEMISQDTVSEVVRSDMGVLAGERIEQAIGLEQAIARAVRNNRDKKLKALEAALALGQMELVQHEMLPGLAASAGYSERNNYAASASVTFDNGQPDPLDANPTYSISQDRERATQDVAFTWNILDFGLSYVRAKQHADRYLIAKERERKVVHNITQEVRAAYWRAVSAERLLLEIDPLITKAAAALDDSRKVEQSQLRSPLEALYYQRELLDILRSLQSLRQDLVNAKTELAALMGMKPGVKFDLADVDRPNFTVPEFNVELETMEETALNQRPELVETYYQKRISAAETRAAMLSMLPGINLTAGSYYDNSDYLLNQDWTSVGAQISWNLLDVFRYGAETRMADTREALVEEQRLAASMAVLTQVHLAKIRYTQTRKSLELAESYLEVARRINQQTRNAAATKSTSDLNLIREALNTLLAELRRDVAYADLQNSYGRIFVTLGMDLVPEDYTEISVDTLSERISERSEQWRRGELVLTHEQPEAMETAEEGAGEETVALSDDEALELIAESSGQAASDNVPLATEQVMEMPPEQAVEAVVDESAETAENVDQAESISFWTQLAEFFSGGSAAQPEEVVTEPALNEAEADAVVEPETSQTEPESSDNLVGVSLPAAQPAGFDRQDSRG